MAAPRVTVLLCVVAPHDQASIAVAGGLLRLQAMFMTMPGRAFDLRLQFVDSLNGALNALAATPQASGAAIMHASKGFNPDFFLAAMDSGLPVVAATYPLAHLDWERVKTQPAGEDPQYWGNVYNVKPTTRAAPPGYVHVEECEFGVAWIAKKAVDDVLARHPEVVADGYAALAVDGVFDGKRMTADQRFMALYGGDVFADIKYPALTVGPQEFGGCVGMRTVLR